MKNYVRKMAEILTLEYIENLKEKHVKTEKYDTIKLGTAAYLLDSRFSTSECELLFKLRSKTIKIKSNF